MSLINDALKRASQAHKDQPPPLPPGPGMEPAQTPEKSKLPIIVILAALLVIVLGISVWLFLGASKPRMTSASASSVRPPLASPANSTKKLGPATNKPTAAVTEVKTGPATNPAPSTPKSSAYTALKSAQTSVHAVTQAARAATQETDAAINTTAHQSSKPGTPGSGLTNASPKAAQPESNSPPATATAQTVPAQAVQASHPSPAESHAEQAQTSAPAAPVGPFPTLRLKGIIYNETSPQVLINGSHLTLGDEIEGARIVKIERSRVTVKWNGQERELLLE